MVGPSGLRSHEKAGVLVGREPSVERTARPVRLRLFWPLLGTAGTLDGDTDDIVDNDVKGQLVVMSRQETGVCSNLVGSFPK